MKGYKAFSDDNGNLMCRDMIYEVGQAYEFDGEPEMCERGYHFCRRLVDCYRYYNTDARVCEVEAGGTVIDGDDGKSVTDHIRIVRELSRDEILDAANIGRGCTGNRNSGDCNSGNRNSGNRNSGNWNSGNCNSGDWNSGNCNSGNCNSGDCNSGDCNSGDWNKTNLSGGALCTQENECLIFDRPSGMTLRDWRNSDAAYLMQRINIDVNRWISSDDMTDAEKQGHPEHETTGGFLRVGTGKPDFAGWWTNLTDRQRDVIKAIPNFDSDKWKLITGIEV